jgi:DNA repair protein RecN (Recombination protein N)
VAIHGQHDQQRLLRPAQQRAALDRFAGADVVALLSGYESGWTRWLRARVELRELQAAEGERRREVDLLCHGLERIAAAAPQPGEDEQLRQRAEVLGHAEGLRRAALDAATLLVGDEAETVAALGAQVRRILDDVAAHDAGVQEWAMRARELSVLATELGADISARVDEFEADPGRLEVVGQRRAALQELARIYTDEETGPGCDGLIAWEARSVVRLGELEASGSTAEHLVAEVDQLTLDLARLALELRAAREAAAVRFAHEVGSELRGLGMPDATLEVELSPLEKSAETLLVDGLEVPAGPRGIDEVELRLAAHPGAVPGPISRVASGGELSRVMLAVEVVFAGADDTSTLVFDEVDAGVGGRAATEVGRRLARLARSHQVLVVTHLPQVAAFADHHLVVSKESDGDLTTSRVIQVDGERRREELARMLAGDQSSGSANEHAQELLDRAVVEISAFR